MDHQTITKAIIRSQHCQRNWDLSREIPEDDINLLATAATQCPSKQNVAFYNLHFITNRSLIEQIHATTDGFGSAYASTVNNAQTQTNSQTLANLLIVFETNNYLNNVDKDSILRNQATLDFFMSKDSLSKETLERDKNMAIGVAAGYLNLTASLLGYNTGCCICFDVASVQKILNIENNINLLMGIGFKNPNLNRRVHHTNQNFVFPTKAKQPIKITHHR